MQVRSHQHRCDTIDSHDSSLFFFGTHIGFFPQAETFFAIPCLLRPSLNCSTEIKSNSLLFYKALKLNKLTLFLALAVVSISPASGFANRRHFTYTYESAVLPKASHELEIWNT